VRIFPDVIDSGKLHWHAAGHARSFPPQAWQLVARKRPAKVGG